MERIYACSMKIVVQLRHDAIREIIRDLRLYRVYCENRCFDRLSRLSNRIDAKMHILLMMGLFSIDSWRCLSGFVDEYEAYQLEAVMS